MKFSRIRVQQNELVLLDPYFLSKEVFYGFLHALTPKSPGICFIFVDRVVDLSELDRCFDQHV